ncbi:MAG: helix-turn-helix transcriptional regulator, partial [bacterium]|nr:helix-turn-helix transcriptional regulator [bacterium]
MSKDPELIKIGERMQAIRKKLGFLQKDFAGELGISGASLSEIEAGNAKPRYELIYNITGKFNVNIYYLLHGRGEMFMPEESEKPFDFGEGGKYRDWVLKFLRYFKDSEMVRHHMISYFR